MRTESGKTLCMTVLLLCLTLIMGIKGYSHQYEAGMVTQPSAETDPVVVTRKIITCKTSPTLSTCNAKRKSHLLSPTQITPFIKVDLRGFSLISHNSAYLIPG